MTWSLVTAHDEQRRCCVVIDDRRCQRATAFRVAAVDGALDDYAYVCAEHRALVAGPGYRVTPVERGE